MLIDNKLFQEINPLKEGQRPYSAVKLLITAQREALDTHNHCSSDIFTLYKGVEDTVVSLFSVFHQTEIFFLYRTLRYGVECYVDLMNLHESDTYSVVMKNYNREELHREEYPILEEYRKKVSKEPVDPSENFRFKWKHKLLLAGQTGQLDPVYLQYINFLYKAGGTCLHPTLLPVRINAERKKARTYEILYAALDLLTESFRLLIPDQSLTDEEKEKLRNYQILTAYEILHDCKNPEDLFDYLLENGVWQEYRSLLDAEDAFPRIGFFTSRHYFRRPAKHSDDQENG